MNLCSFIRALVLLLALAPPVARANEHRAGDGFASLRLPSSLQTVENDRLAKNYEGTRCFDLKDRATRIDLGTVCESGSQAFLKDMGILLAADGAGTADPSLDHALVATPVTQYPLADAKGLAAKTASVDCDTTGNAVYRPTATCQIYLSRTGRQTFLYGSFVVQDHVSHKKGMSSKTMTTLWRELQSASF